MKKTNYYIFFCIFALFTIQITGETLVQKKYTIDTKNSVLEGQQCIAVFEARGGQISGGLAGVEYITCADGTTIKNFKTVTVSPQKAERLSHRPDYIGRRPLSQEALTKNKVKLYFKKGDVHV